MGLYERQLQPRLLNAAMAGPGTAEARGRVCRTLHGKVVEIGHGSGYNQAHLPPSVSGLWAVEPSEVALALGRGRREGSAVPVVLAADDAQDMPFPDDTFDTALSTWTLCGIPDAAAALSEVARVLKPGGVLHFVEHGLAPDPSVARWQRWATPLNRRVCGCPLDRDIGALLAASPLTVTALDTYYLEGAPRTAGWMFEGTAVA